MKKRFISQKGLAGTTSWPVDNVKVKADDHFLIFVSFLGRIANHTVAPEVYVVPSKRLGPLVYHSPNGKRHVLQLSRICLEAPCVRAHEQPLKCR